MSQFFKPTEVEPSTRNIKSVAVLAQSAILHKHQYYLWVYC